MKLLLVCSGLLHCISRPNFSKYEEKQILGKICPKNLRMANTSKNYTSKSESAYSNMPLYQISRNLENIRFWDQICPKNMTDKNFEKINIKIVIRIQQFIPVRNFSHFLELQIIGLNLLKII